MSHTSIKKTKFFGKGLQPTQHRTAKLHGTTLIIYGGVI